MFPPRVVVLRGDGAVIHGPVPGAVTIKGSVGQGGANSREDTKAVQIALNAVPDALGGGGDSLAVDGLVGPLTIGAIKTFQSRWLTILDGRCDPTGPTLGLLNAMPGVGDALPPGTATAAAVSGAPNSVVGAKPGKKKKPGPSAAELTRIRAAEELQFGVDQHHMGIIFHWLIVALRVNDAAQRHVSRLRALGTGGTLPAAALTDEDRSSFLLVAKTFKLHERAVGAAAAGVARVDSILRQSMLLVNQHLPPRPFVVSPPPDGRKPLFVCLFGTPPQAITPVGSVLGYTAVGGLHLQPGPSGFFNPFIKPGVVLPERNDRIYLPPAFGSLNTDLQRLTLLHELAHNVGPAPGQGAVGDIANVDQPAKYKALSSTQRLREADSYGFFATECNIGTEHAVERSGSTLDAIGEFPKVTSFFPSPDPVITLPPPGHPQAAQLNGFPGGFS